MSKLDATVGAISICYALAWGLYGALSMQTFSYFQKFPKDSVTSLWFLETLQLIFIGHVLYFWLITNYNNPAALVDSIWCIGILVTNLIVLIVELFFTYRVYILSGRNWILSGIIVLLAFSYFGFQIVGKVRMFQLKKTSLFFEFQWIASAGLASASVADILIAGSLCYYLAKSRTGLRRTDSIVNQLILYAISTGLLTSIVVLIDMICFLIMPKNLIHLSFNILCGKLYTNSMLSSLSFRDNIRQRHDEFVNTISLPAITRRAPNANVTEDSFNFIAAANTTEEPIRSRSHSNAEAGLTETEEKGASLTDNPSIREGLAHCTAS
ncbi:hypothetical protein FB45DRAFT_248155 [Roridomyces roridus]|uniref:DUF6534 domain-containing protein n=1 Tax=Roridomyces roridus TaxID=1738132 RepID=A0AAD7BA31_9AGAR|nr:hypothetical protein FB45DRAFT_248155 [Roridomyces roridus]